MLVNARDQIINALSNKHEIKCAQVIYGVTYSKEPGCVEEEFTLKVGYSIEELGDFLARLDFFYYNHIRSDEYIAGTIWLNTGEWLEITNNAFNCREWIVKETPQIPDKLFAGISQLSFKNTKIKVGDSENLYDIIYCLTTKGYNCSKIKDKHADDIISVITDSSGVVDSFETEKEFYECSYEEYIVQDDKLIPLIKKDKK